MVEHPFVYEIDTWVWLNELGIDLAGVPDATWDELAALGFDAVWLMGVWERSPAGTAIALQDEANLASFRAALPDFTDADVAGSPYCVRDYTVAAHLGRAEGLAAARAALAARGLGLILDFVPNHVAPDHPWVAEHPDYLVQGDDADLERDPASFIRVGDRVFANGRDPYFPAWRDVVQVNGFSASLRAAAAETLAAIAAQCDGVRCDMAMLLLNDVFERTWGERAGARPDDEYWPAAIAAARAVHPEFVFVAEAYWDLEYALQEQGFDYCYDKRLYDRLVHDDAGAVKAHLSADVAFQGKLLRFIENHDEPRAAATFPPEKNRVAAVTALAQTGARLVHDGQLEGRKVRLPVFLARRPAEEPDQELRAFYERLFAALRDPVFRGGEWQLAQASDPFAAWGWRDDRPRTLVVVNMSDSAAAGQVALAWDDLGGQAWRLTDASDGEVYERSGDDLHDGLYVERGPWEWHLFDLEPA
jgi:hypothetical protein